MGTGGISLLGYIRLGRRTKKATASFTTLSAYLSEPTGVRGGRKQEPRTWLPALMGALGFVEWHRKPPQLQQVKTLLALHLFQTPPDSMEYKQALRWQWYLTSYKDGFFQHMIVTVVKQLKIARIL